MRNREAHRSATHPMLEACWESPIKGTRWLRTWRVGEWLSAPLSPLFKTFLLPRLVAAREHGGSGRLGVCLPKMWRMRKPYYAVVNGYFFARADPDRRSLLFSQPRFLLREACGGATGHGSGNWTARWLQHGLPTYLARLQEYSRLVPSQCTSEDLLHTMDELSLDVAELWYVQALASGSIIPFQYIVRGLASKALSDIDKDCSILSQGIHSQMLEEQQNIYLLAQEIAACAERTAWIKDNPIGDAKSAVHPRLAGFQTRLAQHLEKYGHQVQTLDFISPCLDEDPTPLGVALRCYMEPGAANPAITTRELARDRDQTIAQVGATMGRIRRAMFTRILHRLHRHMMVREDAIFYLQKGWPILRALIAELGHRLARAGVIEGAGDVYFLTADELFVAAAEPAAAPCHMLRVATRRRLWTMRRSLIPPPCIPPPDHDAWASATQFPVALRGMGLGRGHGQRVMVGTVASPGVVRARARVLGFITESARLEEGEVLVTLATTPSWTPLFARAAAVVTDVGAVTSHSAMIAREYGIPAVVGTQRATAEIRDGATITVDGSAGRVYLE